jgi:hypothetical protein
MLRIGQPRARSRDVISGNEPGKGLRFYLQELGGAPRPVVGLTQADILALWSGDGLAALVCRRAEIPYRLESVDLATGNRTLFEEFVPADRTGLLSLREIFVTEDLRSYAYTAYYQVSSLFVSDGRE